MHLHNICEPTTTDDDYRSIIEDDYDDTENGRVSLEKPALGITVQKGGDPDPTTTGLPRSSPGTSSMAKSLRTVLLQNNCLTAFPHVLASKKLFPSLKVIQVHGNPIEYGGKEKLEQYRTNANVHLNRYVIYLK